ncbi:Cardiolipin synthase [Turicibacter sanguinis]|nr:Cardiolipin synthase [Turicibacter sanguinis]
MIGLIVLTMIVYLAGFYYSIQFDSVVAATWGLVYMILSVASVLTWLVIFIYSDSKNKLPWLFIIALFPVIGIILYLMLGHNFRETFRYRRRLKELGPDYVVPSSDYETSDIKTEMSKLSQMLVRLNTMTCRSDVSFRTKTRILTNGDQKFPVLIDAIKNAQEFIFIEYYIFNSDDIGMEVINALKERAQAGVDVKLLFDPLGTSRKMKRSVLREMREAGIVVAEFDPVLVPFLTNKVNHRNHRKIVVVDGRLAITGGINVGDEYIHRSKKFGFWRDTSILVEGEAVRDFAVLFSGDWFFATGERLTNDLYYKKVTEVEDGGVQVIDSGPQSTLAAIKQAFFRMIMGAEKSVYIITPYLIPDFDVITALKNAALAGIDVRIIVPGRADRKFVYYATQSYFEPLLEVGVRIFTYDGVFCHSKVIVVDEEVASVGTTNMDIRSFYLNFEVNVMLYHTESIQSILNDFNIDLSRSTEVIYSQWIKRSAFKRALESLAQLFSSIM